ncbi:hypothetical protein [Streptomyces sp. SBT349]|nr:hypothetical protein [Streptomyces sp. SBT349]
MLPRLATVLLLTALTAAAAPATAPVQVRETVPREAGADRH